MASAVPSTTSQVPLLKPSELEAALITLIKAKQSCMITAPPGVGKSAIVYQVSREFGDFIDMRLSIRDAVDLRGVPFVKDGRTFWAPPAELPTKGSGVLFLDEINAAPPQVQAAAYQLVLDRRLGEYTLPDGYAVIAAGNREEDGAIVHKMSSALNSRFVNLGLSVDHGDWHKWAITHGIHASVLGFVKQFPDELHQFDKTKKSFPCPRTWEFVSKVLHQDGTSPAVERAIIAGSIGQEVGLKFEAFLKLFNELPRLEEILKNPKTAIVPKDTSARYAVSAALATKATPANFGAIIQYAERLPGEYSVMTIQDALRASKQALASTKPYIDWCVRNPALMGGVAA